MEGFAEKGTPSGWDMALGKVRGFRTWTMQLSLRSPYDSARYWTRDYPAGWGKNADYFNAQFLPSLDQASVEGMYGGHWSHRYMRNGWYDAMCVAWPHTPPDSDCGCGFWAYWKPEDCVEFQHQKPWVKRTKTGRDAYDLLIPLAGVIEGSGPTIIGDRGFRTACARITDLTITAAGGCTYEEEWTPFDRIITVDASDLDFMFRDHVHRNEASLVAFLSRELQVPEHLITETIYAAAALSLGNNFSWHESPLHLISACPPDDNYGS